MGKFRSKLKGQNKGRRWAKGQSSSSNPETQKYRDLAKSRFFQDIGPSNLTSDALMKHDAVQSWVANPCRESSEKMDEDDESYCSTVKTMDTFASDWTNCSNMSYGRFLKVFRSDSALHKEMLSILAAITEVIKENGGSETPVEYYCALLTTLEQILGAKDRKEEQVTAILSLLHMGIKKVPVAVLCSGFNAVTKMLLDILNEYASSDNNVIMRSLFGILSEFIKAQELVMWEHTEVVQVFNTILSPFAIHSKPKWRKDAQKGVTSVIVSIALKDASTNPAADKVAEFCQQTLNTCLGGNSGNVLVASIQAGQTTILHTLGLMKLTMPYFSKTNLKKCCEILLRLMSLNYPLVTSCSMQAFNALFSNQKAVMSAQLNAQLITALYDYQPSIQDLQPTLAWITVMQQAHVHLADVDLNTCSMVLPKLFKTFTQLWLAERHEIMSMTTNALKIVLQDCIGPLCSSQELVEENRSKLQKCFQAIELGLGYQFHTVWHQVLHVIGKMFEVAGTYCTDMFMSCLKSLAELRDSYKFSYNTELEHAVGAAVRHMGPEVVLSVISLKKQNDELNLERSWLLVVLKENVRNTTLKFWFTSIFPLAIYCQKRSVQLAELNDGIGSHSAELLHLQLWNLLPSFCNNPQDIKESFKSIAKVLGTAVADRKELRLPVMASLRRLISSAKDNENTEDVNELARFDKNFLPILFNVYTTKPVGTDEEGQRLAALDTIKSYLSISRPELTQQLFNNAWEKLKSSSTESQENAKESSEESFMKESIMDLIRALIPYQNVENITALYNDCIKNLPQFKSKKQQKKAYRLLEDVCSCESEGCKTFLKKNRKSVQGLLVRSLETAAVSSKGSRLRCFNHLMKQQPQLNHESKFLKTVMTEAVICCKDINEKCRATAYDLLNTIGETLTNNNEMQLFVNMLLAGLIGTVQMMSATILALASVLHNFSGILGQENIQCILENIGKLTSVPTREVVGSCLSFMKVYCSALPNPIVAASLPVLVGALTHMTEDCKRHFRNKLRDILDKLVRKYGCDAITPHVPATDVIMYKRLRNLRKLNVRKKKLKEMQKEDDKDSAYDDFIMHSKNKSVDEILADSDSELEDFDLHDDERSNTKRKSKKSEAWIEEDAENIVDFTDPSARTKITATNPETHQQTQASDSKKKGGDRGFKTSSDGRLIIEDQSDSNDEDERKSFDGSDSENQDGNDAETLLLTNRKRKRDNVSVKSGFSSQTQPPSKYKPGGKGIHRPTSTAGSSVGSEFKSKKAGGDTKKKGKVDPYAYLPLQRSTLNKRKRLKNSGQFKNVIKGAKVGARKGAKSKRLRK